MAIRPFGARVVFEGLGAYLQGMAQVQRANSRTQQSSSALVRTLNQQGASLNRFGSQVTSTGRTISGLGSQLTGLGGNLTFAFSAPLLTAVGATERLGRAFEAEMTKIITQVGIARKDVDAFGEGILNLAPAVGRVPQELAEGLFFVTSAGLRGGVAMDVLENSAKLAALGLGNVDSVAKAVTASINTFGQDNLSASQSARILLETVREGSFEASTLASQLGRVNPLVNQLGGNFVDTAAFIATYTRTGVSAAVASTSLRATLSAMIKPSQAAKDALADVGLSAEQLRRSVAEQGLARTLINLRSIFGDNVEGFNKVIGSARALSGVLAVTGALQEDYLAIQNRIAEDSNELAVAFEEVQQTAQFAWESARASAESAGIAIGKALIPTIKEIAGLINVLSQRVRNFAQANPELTASIVRWVALGAAIAPLIFIAGTLISSFGAILTLFGTGITTVIGLGMAFFRLSTGLVSLVALVGRGISLIGTLGAGLLSLLATIRSLGGILLAARTAIVGVWTAMRGWTVASFLLQGGLIAIASPLASLVGLILGVSAAVVGAITIWEVWGDTIRQWFSGFSDAIGNFFSSLFPQFDANFSGLVASAGAWGANISNAFADGIIAGIAKVVQALAALARAVTFWLKPGSPPRILPELDRWGTGAAQAWLDGWSLADFSVLSDLTGTVRSFLDTVGGGDAATIDQLRDFRGGIADLLSDYDTFANITDMVWSNLFETIGESTDQLENYVKAAIRASLATEQVADAQQQIDDINARFDNLIAPLEGRLAEIEKIRQGVEDSQRVEELNEILNDPDVTPLARQLANLELEEIGIRSQIDGLEGQRQQELDPFEQQLALAEEELAVAEEQLELAKAQLDLIIEERNLLQEQLDALAELSSSIGGLSDGIASLTDGLGSGTGGEALGDLGGIGALGDLDLGEFVVPDLTDTPLHPDFVHGLAQETGGALSSFETFLNGIDEDLQLLNESFVELGDAGRGLFDAIVERAKTFNLKELLFGTEPLIVPGGFTDTLIMSIQEIGTVFEQNRALLSTWATETGTRISTWATETSGRFTTWVQTTSNRFTTWWHGVSDGFFAWARNTWTAITTWASETWTAITTWATETYQSFTAWVADVIAEYETWYTETSTSVTTWATETLTTITTWISDTWTAITTWVADVIAEITRLKDEVLAQARTLRDNAIAIFEEIRDRITSAIETARDKVVAAIEDLRDKANSALETLRDIGGGAADAFAAAIEGLRDRVSTAAASVISFLDNMLAAAQRLWDYITGRTFEFNVGTSGNAPSTPSGGSGPSGGPAFTGGGRGGVTIPAASQVQATANAVRELYATISAGTDLQSTLTVSDLVAAGLFGGSSGTTRTTTFGDTIINDPLDQELFLQRVALAAGNSV